MGSAAGEGSPKCLVSLVTCLLVLPTPWLGLFWKLRREEMEGLRVEVGSILFSKNLPLGLAPARWSLGGPAGFLGTTPVREHLPVLKQRDRGLTGKGN